MPSLAETLATAVRVLRAENCTMTPELDVKLLAGHVLGIDNLQLMLQHKRQLTAEERQAIAAFVERRMRSESVARIIGRRDFWGLTFALGPDVLEPRPDSETVIEAALALFHDRRQALRILDLGTGSGCLLLALLSELPYATGIGIDAALAAVTQASYNAALNRLSDRAQFLQADWTKHESFWPAVGADGYDLVIANPPYIREADIPKLMPEVRAYDPLKALQGGIDGLDAYRAIAPLLPRLLKPQGYAVFETGQGQARDVERLLQTSGLKPTDTKRDLAGIERCVIAQN